MNTFRTVRLVAVIASALACMVARPCVGSEAEPLDPQKIDAIKEQILADWRARQRRFSSARYSIKGQVTVPKGKRTGSFDAPPGEWPEQDFTYPLTRDWTLDFTSHRLRRDTTQMGWLGPEARFIPYGEVLTWNGARRELWKPKERNPDMFPAVPEPPNGSLSLENNELMIVDEALDLSNFIETDDLPIFLFHGIAQMGAPGKGELSVDFAARNFEVLSVDPQGKLATISTTYGEPSIAEFRYRYVVDLTRRSFVLESAFYAKDQLQIEMKSEPGMKHDELVPLRWNCIKYRDHLTGDIDLSTTYELIDCAFNESVSDSEFNTTLRPGMRVMLNNKYTMVASDGKTMIPLRVSNGIVSLQTSPESHPSRARLYVGLLGAQAVAFFVVWGIRRRKNVSVAAAHASNDSR